MESRAADKWFIAYRVVGGIFGWIWLLSIPVNLGLIVYATFFGGGWIHVLYSFIIGGVGKWLSRGFTDHSERVAVEAYLIANGASKEVAGDIWLRLYAQGGPEAARRVFNLNDDNLALLCRNG